MNNQLQCEQIAHEISERTGFPFEIDWEYPLRLGYIPGTFHLLCEITFTDRETTWFVHLFRQNGQTMVTHYDIKLRYRSFHADYRSSIIYLFQGAELAANKLQTLRSSPWDLILTNMGGCREYVKYLFSLCENREDHERMFADFVRCNHGRIGVSGLSHFGKNMLAPLAVSEKLGIAENELRDLEARLTKNLDAAAMLL